MWKTYLLIIILDFLGVGDDLEERAGFFGDISGGGSLYFSGDNGGFEDNWTVFGGGLLGSNWYVEPSSFFNG